jgi:hypothetical protein
MSDTPRPTAIERAILDAPVEGDLPVFAERRKQAEIASVTDSQWTNTGAWQRCTSRALFIRRAGSVLICATWGFTWLALTNGMRFSLWKMVSYISLSTTIGRRLVSQPTLEPAFYHSQYTGIATPSAQRDLVGLAASLAA